MATGADTMPIRIPISMDAAQLTDDSEQAVSAISKIRDKLHAFASAGKTVGKSLADMRQNEMDLVKSLDAANKRLADARERYNAASESGERNAETMAKLAAEITKSENQMAKLTRRLEYSQLDQATYDADQLAEQMRNLDRQTDIVTATMTANGETAEIAATRYQALTKKFQLQGQIVAELRKQLENAKRQYGENSNVVQALAQKLNDASNAEKNLAEQVNKTSQAFRQQGDDAQNSANSIVSGIGQIMASETGLQRVGDALTNNVTKPIVDFGKSALQAAVDAQSMESSFNRAFGDMADGARAWSQAVSDKMQVVSQTQVREMMLSWETMLDSMDIGDKQRADMVQGLIQRSIDLAARQDASVQESFDKIQAGLVGSSEPLRAWGIIITENMVKNYAWKNGIASTGAELTEQQKILARYKLILEQTNDAQGQQAAEMDDASSKIKKYQAKIDELQVKLGNSLLPVLEQLLGVLVPIAEWFTNLPDWAQTAVIWIAAIAAVAGPIIKIISAIQQMKVAAGITKVTKAASGMSNLFSGPMSAGIAKVIGYLMILAVTIAFVAGMIALANGNMAKYQDALNQTKKLESQVQGARTTAQNATVQRNARGSTYYRGGETWVGEEGPERVVLPQGSRIMDARRSARTSGGDTYNLQVNMDQVGDVNRLITTAKNAKRIARQRPAMT